MYARVEGVRDEDICGGKIERDGDICGERLRK
jgi:hypothetical protein